MLQPGEAITGVIISAYVAEHINSFTTFTLNTGAKVGNPFAGTINGGAYFIPKKPLRPSCVLAYLNGWADTAVNGLEFVFKC